MSAPESEWGPNLYAYLDAYWQAEGTNANAWTDKHPGIQGPTVSRWRGGTVPSLPAMNAVAVALDVPMLDVLIATGVVDRADVGRDAVRPAAPSIDVAIAADPSLDDWMRPRLAEILDAFRKVNAGQAESVRSKPAKRATPARRSR